MNNKGNSINDALELIKIIKKDLDYHSYVYLTSPKNQNVLVVKLIVGRINLDLYIFAYERKINIRLIFPVFIESDAFPILALFLAEYNNKAFSNLRINPLTGSIFFDYSYLVCCNDFNSDSFWLYIRSMTSEACKLYLPLNQMARGKLDPEKKEIYINMLKMAIAKLQSYCS